MSLELISFAVDSITPPNNPPPFPPLPPIICADRLIMYITNPVEKNNRKYSAGHSLLYTHDLPGEDYGEASPSNKLVCFKNLKETLNLNVSL